MNRVVIMNKMEKKKPWYWNKSVDNDNNDLPSKAPI